MGVLLSPPVDPATLQVKPQQSGAAVLTVSVSAGAMSDTAALFGDPGACLVYFRGNSRRL